MKTLKDIDEKILEACWKTNCKGRAKFCDFCFYMIVLSRDLLYKGVY